MQPPNTFESASPESARGRRGRSWSSRMS